MTGDGHAGTRAGGDLLRPVRGGVSAASAAAGARPPRRPWRGAEDEVKHALAPGRQTDDVDVVSVAAESERVPLPLTP